MEFQPENISSLESSTQFLIDAMVKASQYVTRGSILENKPFWMVQTEKFSSFFTRIKDKLEAMDNFRTKVIVPVYETHNAHFISELISPEGVVQDDYLKVTLEQSSDFRIKTSPGGIFFQLDKLFLPVSEVYTQSVNYSIKHKNEDMPYPVLILLGFYSTVYHAVKDREDSASMELMKKNIQVLADSLESYDQPVKKTAQGPVDLLQNMLGNFDMGQIGEMMGKVTGDERASKEFGEVFSKMTDVIKSGGNPLDAMGDIIKNASMRLQDEPAPAASAPAPTSEEEVSRIESQE